MSVKQAPDEITIVTRTPARAEALKQAIVLRGFDEITCLDARIAARACQTHPPVLVIVDMEGSAEETLRFIEAMPVGVKSLVLADVFDESLFLACHDHGARDFMVHPVPDALLVSRVIRNLQEHRLEQVSQQKDQILVKLDVLSERSGVFTMSYFINLLRDLTESWNPGADEPMSLLILKMGGCPSPLPASYQYQLMSKVGATIKECARGLDEVGEYFVDKFAVIMPQTGIRGARALANRLKQRLHGLGFEGPNGNWPLSVEIGVAEYAGCRNYEEFLNLAMNDSQQLPAASGKAVVSASMPPISQSTNLI